MSDKEEYTSQAAPGFTGHSDEAFTSAPGSDEEKTAYAPHVDGGDGLVVDRVLHRQ